MGAVRDIFSAANAASNDDGIAYSRRLAEGLAAHLRSVLSPRDVHGERWPGAEDDGVALVARVHATACELEAIAYELRDAPPAKRLNRLKRAAN